MTTLTTSAVGPILAIDLGKYKSVGCTHEGAGGEIAFTTFETTRAELQRLIGRDRPAVVIIEACLLAGWVHDLCGEVGVPCVVANTASEAWKFKHLKRKTDRDDALRLAQLYWLGQLPTVNLPPWRPVRGGRRFRHGRRQGVVQFHLRRKSVSEVGKAAAVLIERRGLAQSATGKKLGMEDVRDVLRDAADGPADVTTLPVLAPHPLGHLVPSHGQQQPRQVGRFAEFVRARGRPHKKMGQYGLAQVHRVELLTLTGVSETKPQSPPDDRLEISHQPRGRVLVSRLNPTDQFSEVQVGRHGRPPTMP